MEKEGSSRKDKLERLLGFGRFQKLQVILFMGIASALGGMNLFQFTFLITSQAFRCSLPKQIESNFGISDFNNHSDIVGQCEMAPLTNRPCKDINSVEQILISGCFDEDANKTKCIYGYTHEREEDEVSNGYFWSLTAENDWVCDQDIYGANMWLAQSVGFILHGIIFSQLSDA